MMSTSRSLVIQRVQPSLPLSHFLSSHTRTWLASAHTRHILGVSVSTTEKSEIFMSRAIRCVDRHHHHHRLAFGNTATSSSLSPFLPVSTLTLMQSNFKRKEKEHKNHRDLAKELEAGIGTWNGPAVFEQQKQQGHPLPSKTKTQVDKQALRTSPEPISTPIKPFGGSGNIHSPISISSSSPSPSPSPSSTTSPLSRPRAIPHFSSPLPRTAFTPLRASPALSQTHTQTKDKPLHPFFARSRTAPPPPTNRPRLVAHYSSTSVTTETTSSQSQSQSQNSQESKAKTRAKANTDKWEAEMTFIADQIEAIDFGGSSQGQRKPLTQPKRLPVQVNSSSAATTIAPKWKGKSKSTINDRNTISLPIFQYTSYTPPPQVVYTTSTEEANDLLSCLKGNVLGFDMEWPPAGKYKVEQPDGTFKEKRVGMKFNESTRKWEFGQGRTALVQFCDEKLVVLVHLGEDMELPSKVVEIVNDPTIYKLGVQVRGDGLKLLRDFPHLFNTASSGPSGLLELSYLARTVDPIGTGPGSTLIKLSTLCSEYLGKELEKPADVRKGNWFGALGPRERDYAANDVYSSLKIFRHLENLAQERNIILNLDKFCSNLSPSSTSDILNSTSRTDLGISSSSSNSYTKKTYSPDCVYVGERKIPLPPGTKAPTPAQINALAGFMDGVGVSDLADIKSVKRITIEGYILNAIGILGIDPLSRQDKKRLSIEIPSSSSIWIRHKSLQSILTAPAADSLTLPTSSAFGNRGKNLVELSSSPIASEDEGEGSDDNKDVMEDTEVDTDAETEEEEEVETVENR